MTPPEPQSPTPSEGPVSGDGGAQIFYSFQGKWVSPKDVLAQMGPWARVNRSFGTPVFYSADGQWLPASAVFVSRGGQWVRI